ncbi:hypothetical protein CN931_23815 [Bacillus sp. AFS054943]|uniref:HTH cro/C1-type domain-containing protein n=1 Tax=Bacillus cereus TaxID=1396 RepID=A0A2C1LPE9_BACCE|nr:hypothetical protein CN931_23815 [Bacillus sp. AFS054943]PGT99829.1 hypothetical protein COD19_18015 [Bacillus cereus]
MNIYSYYNSETNNGYYETPVILNNKEVGSVDKIRVFRRKKGWSQFKLAEEAGVSQTTISQLENKKRIAPTFESIKRIAKALGVRIEELETIDR